jgi:hypothetical protein
MGYYSTGSTAIKASHSLYNICAEQMELNKDFYIKGNDMFLYIFIGAGALNENLLAL